MKRLIEKAYLNKLRVKNKKNWLYLYRKIKSSLVLLKLPKISLVKGWAPMIKRLKTK